MQYTLASTELVANKLTEDQGWYKLYDGPRIYAGHTRFATTSKATMDGTHPHQWTPPQQLVVSNCNLCASCALATSQPSASV